MFKVKQLLSIRAGTLNPSLAAARAHVLNPLLFGFQSDRPSAQDGIDSLRACGSAQDGPSPTLRARSSGSASPEASCSSCILRFNPTDCKSSTRHHPFICFLHREHRTPPDSLPTSQPLSMGKIPCSSSKDHSKANASGEST